MAITEGLLGHGLSKVIYQVEATIDGRELSLVGVSFNRGSAAGAYGRGDVVCHAPSLIKHVHLAIGFSRCRSILFATVSSIKAKTGRVPLDVIPSIQARCPEPGANP